MRVLITGNMGYVGSALVRYLARTEPELEMIGFDTAYFGHTLTGAADLPERQLARQHMGDIRDITEHPLQGVDAVIHLAAISNDPMGQEFEAVTADINQEASLRLVGLAAQAGVRSFVFASSCSIYGAGGSEARKETDPTNPLTAYARSKLGTEDEVKKMSLNNMTFTSLRFATACGMSDRLRLDLVLNDFVASAISTGQIAVLSDGSPWRPLIDVEDMARLISWAMRRQANNGGPFVAVNGGLESNTFQIRELAGVVADQLPGTSVAINTEAMPDRRSYRVDFSLLRALAPEFLPRLSIVDSIARLVEGLRRMAFSDADFRESAHVRLHVLRQHRKAGRLNEYLRWTAHHA